MRKTAEMMEGTHKRKSLHDKLLHQWEIENANELGDVHTTRRKFWWRNELRTCLDEVKRLNP